jgi:inosose dehydratase
MSIRFGVSPIAWINDDMPELGGDTPVARVLEEARDLGFSGIELGGKFPRDPESLRSLLDEYGLSLIGGWYSASLLIRSAEEEIEALQGHLALLKAMGCEVFIQAETSNAIHGARGHALSETPRLANGEWKQFGERLSRVAAYVQAEGLRFAYHHHLGTVVESKDDLENFLRHTEPGVGLTLDTGHAALGGIDPVRLIEEAPSRIAHVHCKDVRRPTYDMTRGGGKSFLDGVLAGMFTVPGDGSIDYAAVMRALAAIGYSGWIVLEAEQDPALANPRTYAELGLKTLRYEALAAGLKEAA